MSTLDHHRILDTRYAPAPLRAEIYGECRQAWPCDAAIGYHLARPGHHFTVGVYLVVELPVQLVLSGGTGWLLLDLLVPSPASLGGYAALTAAIIACALAGARVLHLARGLISPWAAWHRRALAHRHHRQTSS